MPVSATTAVWDEVPATFPDGFAGELPFVATGKAGALTFVQCILAHTKYACAHTDLLTGCMHVRAMTGIYALCLSGTTEQNLLFIEKGVPGNV